jgi:hypothetical protein
MRSTPLNAARFHCRKFGVQDVRVSEAELKHKGVISSFHGMFWLAWLFLGSWILGSSAAAQSMVVRVTRKSLRLYKYRASVERAKQICPSEDRVVKKLMSLKCDRMGRVTSGCI